MPFLCRVASLLLLTSALPAFASSGTTQEPEELQVLLKELRTQEVKVERLKVYLSPAADAAEAETGLRAQAAHAGLAAVDLKPVPEITRVPLEDGRPSPVELRRLDVSGRDPYEKVEVFLSFLVRSQRLFDLEGLHLEAGANDTVRFTVRLAVAYCTDPCSGHVDAAPLPATFQDETLDGFRSRDKALDAERQAAARKALTGSMAEQKDLLESERTIAERKALLYQMIEVRRAFLERVLFERTILATQARFRANRRIVGGLAGFIQATHDQALALSEVHFTGDTLLRGVVLGAPSRAAIKPALEKAGFRVSRLDFADAGRCQSFSVTARLGEGEVAAPGVAFNGLFDAQAAAVCGSGAAPPAGRIAVRSAAPGAAAALTLRLRDVDTAEVFRVLHELSGQAFIVDSDVQGRVDVEVSGATLDEALAAMASAGLAVGPGPLRRVSRAVAPRPVERSQDHTGAAVSLSFRDGDLLDVLTLFEDISGLKIFVAGDSPARVTVFAREVPWDLLLESMIDSSGLKYAIDKDRIYVGLDPAAMMRDPQGVHDVAKPSRAYRHEWWRAAPVSLAALGVDDLKPAGYAGVGDTWKVYANSPTRMLWPLEKGQALFDGTVGAVTQAAVTFQRTSGKTVDVPLPR